jgi:hypothetical protein
MTINTFTTKNNENLLRSKSRRYENFSSAKGKPVLNFLLSEAEHVQEAALSKTKSGFATPNLEK